MFDDKETEVIGAYIKAENSTDQKASLGDKVDKLENIGDRQHIVGQCFLDTFYYNPHEEIDFIPGRPSVPPASPFTNIHFNDAKVLQSNQYLD